MRTIGVVTVGRSDYGIYRPVLRRILEEKDLKLHLIVAGAHFLERYGKTVEEIKQDGFEIAEAISLSYVSDQPAGIVATMGEALKAFSESFQKRRPDILVVLGDRYEMHAAALAALPFNIPVAHIHGGELTLGAIDNSLRQSITLLSHLHFAATKNYCQRILQLGEEPWRVYVTGAPALDAVKDSSYLSLQELSKKFDLPLKEKPILVTFHPVTLEYEKTEWQIGQLLKALENLDHPILFTGTNADTQNTVIQEQIKSFVENHRNSYWVANFGPNYYFSLLKNALMMVGNSSSGLIEAPSFELPMVNVGTRQEGRVRAKNVIDVGYATEEIVKAIKKGLSKDFRESLKEMKNPYDADNASEKIVAVLKEVSLDQKLICKQFVDHEP